MGPRCSCRASSLNSGNTYTARPSGKEAAKAGGEAALCFKADGKLKVFGENGGHFVALLQSHTNEGLI